MKYYEDVLGLIGNTPLVRLNKLVPPGSATVLAKMEQLNPGGSVKDRMAYNMVKIKTIPTKLAVNIYYTK